MRRFIRSEASRRFPAGVVPGLVAVGLLIVWAVHEGGFFPDTWYWGALATLALLTVTVLSLGLRLGTIPPTVRAALVFLGLYVMWSYLSITWAQYPGAALEGSNRTLLYWLVFALFAVVPWTVEAALAAMAAFVLAVGTVAVVIMIRLATGDHIVGLFIFGRLATPTGYYNASAALFTMSAVVAVALAARRELPVPLRAVLLAIACAGLQLALIGQSRGWLFTLPLVALAAVAVLSDRLRLVVAATAPIVATLVAVHRLLDVYRVSANGNLVGRAFRDAAMRAGRTSLVLCAAVLLVGALMALADGRLPPLTLSGARRRALGLAVAAVVVVGGSVGATVATHGRPFHFVAREWDGFSHVPTGPAPSSNFTQVGSGRYDFWRVALDAVLAHPIGGLGQDNFADYYMRRRRTAEQPEWTHSLEMRLLAHTGFVGFALFAIFLASALVAALAARRRARALGRAVVGAALLPLAVWTIHGSVDWFWEFPALSGPALGFLGMATRLGWPALGALGTATGAEGPGLGALGTATGTGGPGPSEAARSEAVARAPRTRVARIALAAGGVLAVGAAALALGIPYLAVRETAQASAISASDPAAALRDLARAARLNPLSVDPALDGGVLALRIGRYGEAEQRFRQAITREPGGWEAWLGDGLAASALGNRSRARHDFLVSRSINGLQRVTSQALARLRTRSPLPPAEALRELAQQL